MKIARILIASLACSMLIIPVLGCEQKTDLDREKETRRPAPENPRQAPRPGGGTTSDSAPGATGG